MNEKKDLIQQYAAMSESWNREQTRKFWAEQKRKNSAMWQALGEMFQESGIHLLGGIR